MTCRDMKKYKKDFMQSLSCALLIMKRDHSIKHLKGPWKTMISFRGYDNESFEKCKKTNQYIVSFDFQIIVCFDFSPSEIFADILIFKYQNLAKKN
jgi:hypothetical protein